MHFLSVLKTVYTHFLVLVGAYPRITPASPVCRRGYEQRTIVIGDNAVVVTGFYTFTRMVEGKPIPGPSRFTVLVTKRGSEWRLAHHHSSPLVLPKN
jgi:hypothetical protein